MIVGIRWRINADGTRVLEVQWAHLTCDASGALCGLSIIDEWQEVPDVDCSDLPSSSGG